MAPAAWPSKPALQAGGGSTVSASMARAA